MIGVLQQRSGTIIIVVVVALFVGYSVHTAVESRRTQAVARAKETKAWGGGGLCGYHRYPVSVFGEQR